MTFEMNGYVDVKTRLTEALTTHPELRITEHRPEIVQVGEQLFVECSVTVSRNPDDPIPVTAYMFEPYPGRTPYTKLSEQANGATSALGRALGYMGFGITASLASANEVRNRSEEEQYPEQVQPAAQPAQPGPRVTNLQERRTGTAASKSGKCTDRQLEILRDMANERGLEITWTNDLTYQEASDMITTFKTLPKVKK